MEVVGEGEKSSFPPTPMTPISLERTADLHGFKRRTSGLSGQRDHGLGGWSD
jgi:hypothetical protein